jgi:uncharacterized membrane protein
MMKSIEELELKISKLLRYGVVISGVMMFIGWSSNLQLWKDPFFNFQIYDEIPLLDLLQHYYKRKDWGPLISYFGLFTLISLPIIRVVLTSYLFVRQKEYILASIAFIVFIGLAVSMVLGIEL